MKIVITIQNDEEDTEYELKEWERVVVDKNTKIEINIPWK